MSKVVGVRFQEENKDRRGLFPVAHRLCITLWGVLGEVNSRKQALDWGLEDWVPVPPSWAGKH